MQPHTTLTMSTSNKYRNVHFPCKHFCDLKLLQVTATLQTAEMLVENITNTHVYPDKRL